MYFKLRYQLLYLDVERLHSTFIQNTTHVFLALALLKMRVVKTVSLNSD